MMISLNVTCTIVYLRTRFFNNCFYSFLWYTWQNKNGRNCIYSYSSLKNLQILLLKEGGLWQFVLKLRRLDKEWPVHEYQQYFYIDIVCIWPTWTAEVTEQVIQHKKMKNDKKCKIEILSKMPKKEKFTWHFLFLKKDSRPVWNITGKKHIYTPVYFILYILYTPVYFVYSIYTKYTCIIIFPSVWYQENWKFGFNAKTTLTS